MSKVIDVETGLFIGRDRRTFLVKKHYHIEDHVIVDDGSGRVTWHKERWKGYREALDLREVSVCSWGADQYITFIDYCKKVSIPDALK